jgi:hypothetical protein
LPIHPPLGKSQSNNVLIWDVLAQVEAAAVDVSTGAHDIRADEAEPQSGEATRGNASTPRPMSGSCLDLVACSPGLSLSGNASLNNAVSAPRSLGAKGLGPLKQGCHANPMFQPCLPARVWWKASWSRHLRGL